MLRSVRMSVLAFIVVITGLMPFASGAQDTSPPDTPSVADVAQPGGTLPGAPEIALELVVDGLVDPVHVTNAGDGSDRLFVVERVGRIRIVENGTLLDQPFLDLTNEVKTDFLEQGLLGLAFHPDYANNGKFYVYYSQYLSNGAHTLAELTVSSDDPNQADPTSLRILLQEPDPYFNHNGGQLAFGPDGYLYLGIGDGGSAGDPWDQAQDLSKIFGKILRIDVDNGSPYGIPADNPYADAGQVLPSSQIAEPGRYHPDGRPEVWASGLRNPWSFQFDGETGDLYIADVGQNFWEEINVQPAGEGGQNYGWDILEGTHCYPADVTDCKDFGTLPVAEYDHGDGSCSILGLGVYRSEVSPELDGIYFAGDYCSGKIWGLAQDDAGTWQFQELLDTQLLFPGSGIGEDGQLYVTSGNLAFGKNYDPYTQSHGAVWRLVSADNVTEGAILAPLEGEAVPDATPVADVVATDQEPVTEAEIVSFDIYFEPVSVVIAADTDVTITLPNRGALPHNFEIEGTGISVDIPAGETATVTVNLPPGEYQFICNVAGHAAAGMVGTIVVQ